MDCGQVLVVPRELERVRVRGYWYLISHGSSRNRPKRLGLCAIDIVVEYIDVRSVEEDLRESSMSSISSKNRSIDRATL